MNVENSITPSGSPQGAADQSVLVPTRTLPTPGVDPAYVVLGLAAIVALVVIAAFAMRPTINQAGRDLKIDTDLDVKTRVR